MMASAAAIETELVLAMAGSRDCFVTGSNGEIDWTAKA